VFEIILGAFGIIIALLPGGKFTWGKLGTKQQLPAMEPAWIGRLIIGGIGLGLFLDGIRQMRHR
jgi:hypothetical protein